MNIPQNVRQCIEDCLQCYQVCTETSAMCLEMGGKHADPGHLTTMHDCAEICDMAAGFMSRSSEFGSTLCGVCAEICRRCSESCRELAADGEFMQRCADVCEHCAQSCEAMSGQRRRAA